MKAALEAEKVALSNALATFADASLIFFAHGASLSSCACCKPTFKRLHRFSKASHFCGRLGGRSVKALDSIHVAKARREQEAVGKNEKPIKAVDSIAVTKARREDKDRNEILMDTWIFEVCKMCAFSPPPKKKNYCTKRQNLQIEKIQVLQIHAIHQSGKKQIWFRPWSHHAKGFCEGGSCSRGEVLDNRLMLKC